MYDVTPVSQTFLFRDTTASLVTSGSTVAPAASTILGNISGLAAGDWLITCAAYYGATGDVAQNVVLQKSLTTVVRLPMQGGNNTAPVMFQIVITSAGTDSVQLLNIAAGAVGSVYNTILCAQRIG